MSRCPVDQFGLCVKRDGVKRRIARLKSEYSLFEITHQPELCAKVTALPVHEYDVDAAILLQG